MMHAVLTEPSSAPVNPPCPWLPTTSMSAPRAARTSTSAGCPSTTDERMTTSGSTL